MIEKNVRIKTSVNGLIVYEVIGKAILLSAILILCNFDFYIVLSMKNFENEEKNAV